jgi:hypothetical protein
VSATVLVTLMKPDPREIKAGQLRKWSHPARGGIFFVAAVEDLHNIIKITYIEDGEIKESLMTYFIEQSSEPIDTGDTNDL